MPNSIISITELTTANTRKFKDKRLAEATSRISAIYADAAKFVDTKNREIATILAEVMEQKSYEKDGFKSVGDYAKEVFGINRQNAYALANAGKVYNNADAPDTLKAMSPSKLAEVSKVPAETLEKALEEGKISASSTQKELREFAASTKATEPEVLDTFTARPCAPAVSEKDADTYSSARTIPEWEDYFLNSLQEMAPSRAPECIKLPKAIPVGVKDAKKATIERRLFTCDCYSIVVEFHKAKAPAATAAPKFTKEQLLAMLAALEK